MTRRYAGRGDPARSPIVGGIFGPLELLPLLIAAALYAKRSTTLAARGRPVPLWRQLCFAAGLLTISRRDRLADRTTSPRNW